MVVKILVTAVCLYLLIPLWYARYEALESMSWRDGDDKKEAHRHSQYFETGAAISTMLFIAFEIWLWS